MTGTSGLSRARLAHALRTNTRPAPVDPHDLAPAAGGSDVAISEGGLNLTPSTGVVFVPDQAATDETATVTDVTVTDQAGGI